MYYYSIHFSFVKVMNIRISLFLAAGKQSEESVTKYNRVGRFEKL